MMDMEVDLFSNVVSEEDTVEVEVDVDNENFGDEGERCGICMDIVIDRGVLDCCQHWFCFDCIDNWATITNLCPLCQNEFQLITCIPVFDTIGSSKSDEDLDSRDDDWCIEEKDNKLAFPSYYIDENAVTCLDGGGCKIRSGSLTPEEVYHAFCVGFDPEGSEVDSWLCPRCHGGAEQKYESKEMSNTEGQLSLPIGDHHSLVHTCSGKVSISVADDGETALVVSRVDGEDVAKVSIANCVSTHDVTNYREIEQLTWTPNSSSSELNKPSDQGKPQPTIVSVKLEEHDDEWGPNEEQSIISPDLKLSLASTSSNKSLHASETNPSADEYLADRKTNITSKAVKKRKHAESSIQMNNENGHLDVQLVAGSSTKRLKARKGIRKTSNDKTDIRCSETVHKISKGSEGAVADKGGIKKCPSVDIMNIIKGTESRNQKDSGKDAKVQKNAARLRVKKIMRRPNENKESVETVQKLKQEIREAVRKKSSDTGKSIVDPNLLAAFRAAVAEPAQKPPPVNVKAKKLMLQKGKAREHLTKKIYAMSNGKRKRAWDRDCEVEFWKHRCVTTSKPEKIATLKSVLNLLQRSPGSKIVGQNSKEEEQSPILSRLYLADASVFPRKDDIKPLSVLKASTNSHKNGMLPSTEKGTKSFLDSCSVKIPSTKESPAESNTTAEDENKKGSTCINNGVVARKLNTSGQSDKSSTIKKITCKTEGVPIDKKKWALEILARKKASSGTSPNHQKQDDAVFKGNYPLLAELPTDMRPELAPIRHNKIPSSVRQAQLYRLTEHFLKMANLPSICRTAATELAVADAVNIEKQAADRSISKVVYLNLCSQELRRHTNLSTPLECTPSSPSPVPTEAEHSFAPALGSETEAALRAAGLLSDSPPSSPLQTANGLNSCDSPVGKEEETENIFEMDSHPDLDIYGDFEYDLDEEDYIGATAIASSKPQAEEGESKVKVVFSTLTISKPESEEQNLVSSTSLLGHDADVESAHIEGIKDSVPLVGNTPVDGEGEELSVVECEELYGPEKEPLIREFPILVSADNSTSQSANDLDLKNPDKNHPSVVVEGQSPSPSQAVENTHKEKSDDPKVDKKSQTDSVIKKVEAYVKEHIRPLCKSGVITVEQYRWAVGKTTDKVMKYHTKAKNANFLIKDGDKVKKLAEQYIEAAKHKENK
ncbi:hypothetical protein KSS87_020009 [Heliosperma pusillum]|nr:hypothetical protein KSS87_020009 [Heliosperma pusillum]